MELLLERNVEVAAQRFEWSTVRLTGKDGEVRVKLCGGALMGDL